MTTTLIPTLNRFNKHKPIMDAITTYPILTETENLRCTFIFWRWMIEGQTFFHFAPLLHATNEQLDIVSGCVITRIYSPELNIYLITLIEYMRLLEYVMNMHITVEEMYVIGHDLEEFMPQPSFPVLLWNCLLPALHKIISRIHTSFGPNDSFPFTLHWPSNAYRLLPRGCNTFESSSSTTAIDHMRSIKSLKISPGFMSIEKSLIDGSLFNKRLIIQFSKSRVENENDVQCTYMPVHGQNLRSHVGTVSCILWKNIYYMTSFDFIRLLEYLTDKQCSSNDKKTIRRKLEKYKSITACQRSLDTDILHSLVVSLDNPKPYHYYQCRIKMLQCSEISKALTGIFEYAAGSSCTYDINLGTFPYLTESDLYKHQIYNDYDSSDMALSPYLSQVNPVIPSQLALKFPNSAIYISSQTQCMNDEQRRPVGLGHVSYFSATMQNC